ncbi:MAG: TPM domain-containing protein [Saprospiraceae bacterium]|nr:TPM domain-containing protein [Saprospiraceae bacterium]
MKHLILLWLLLFTTGWMTAQDLPPRPDPPRLVNDLAGMLAPEEVAALEAKLVAYDDSTGTQFVVLTVPDLGGWEISEFAYSVGDAWGVGQEKLDNGLVIAISRDDRKVFLATGRGLEGALPDVLCHRIVDNIMVPAFKQGQFHEGIDRAVDAAILAIGGEFVREVQEPEVPVVPLIIIGVLILLIFIGAVAVFRYGASHGGTIFSGGWSGPVTGSGRGWGGGGGFGGGGGGFGGFGGGSFGGGGAGGSW